MRTEHRQIPSLPVLRQGQKWCRRGQEWQWAKVVTHTTMEPPQLARSSQRQYQAGQTGPKLNQWMRSFWVEEATALGQDTMTQVDLQESLSFTTSRGKRAGCIVTLSTSSKVNKDEEIRRWSC